MTSRGFLPLEKPVSGMVRVPGSKSITIRALAAAALAPGRSHLYGSLDADDPHVMAGVLRAMGVAVDTASDPWTVHGGAMRRPDGPLDAGESGLTARIAIALATCVDGEVVVDGRGRLRQRPMGPLVAALESQGIPVSSRGARLPVGIGGRGGLWGGEIHVDISFSTQFASALMLVAPTASNPVTLELDGPGGAVGYLEMTRLVMAWFGAEVRPTTTGFTVANTGYQPADVTVPADASAAVYPMVAAAITGSTVTIPGLSMTDAQPDLAVAGRLAEMGCVVTDESEGLTVTGPVGLEPIVADMKDAPDGALALAVACLFASGTSVISGLGTLRVKESDRLTAMAEGLGRLGAVVEVEGDSLAITPGRLVPNVMDAYGDHRVAMSLALAGLVVDGVEVAESEVVTKTWPGFWEAMGEWAGPNFR
jgi:3-phosphoshikimate 1-carboxyvinyltransferase